MVVLAGVGTLLRGSWWCVPFFAAYGVLYGSASDSRWHELHVVGRLTHDHERRGHHMFPMVPYHRLPELHEEIKGDLAPAYPSIWAAYRELAPAVLRQLKDQSYYVRRELPPGARPFHEPSTVNDGRALPLLPA
jgi:fatty acid desaturase